MAQAKNGIDYAPVGVGVEMTEEEAQQIRECNEDCTGCKRDVGSDFICQRMLDRMAMEEEAAGKCFVCNGEGAKYRVGPTTHKLCPKCWVSYDNAQVELKALKYDKASDSYQLEATSQKEAFEVIVDLGKPSSEIVASLDEVKKILKDTYVIIKDGDYAHADVRVFDLSKDECDITDTMCIQEMIADVMEEVDSQEPTASSEDDLEDHNIHVEEALLEAMEEEPGKQLPVPNTEGIQHRPADMIFPGRREAIQGHTCMICKGKVEGFKDELSQKEYLISGLCQECQDKIFKEPEDIPNDSRAEICKARAEAMGLEACLDCPVRCNVSDDNYNKLINLVESIPEAFPDRESGPAKEQQCTYGDGLATSKCAGCGKPLCPSCGFKLGDDRLCNACFELDPR